MDWPFWDILHRYDISQSAMARENSELKSLQTDFRENKNMGRLVFTVVISR